jgi:hypothetical protein
LLKLIKDMKILGYYVIVILFELLLTLVHSQSVFSLIIANNPFSMSNARIDSVNDTTSDGKFLVDLEYTPELARKGQLTFLKINLFDDIGDKQTRIGHFYCDLIILKDNIELFKISRKYGEPLYHVISGTFLASFPFNETGIYKVAVEVAGINFIPIKPVFVNFSAIVPPTSDENLKIKLST